MPPKSKRKQKGKMKLGFLVPVCVEQLAKEDSSVLARMPILNAAVNEHNALKKRSSTMSISRVQPASQHCTQSNTMKIRRVCTPQTKSLELTTEDDNTVGDQIMEFNDSLNVHSNEDTRIDSYHSTVSCEDMIEYSQNIDTGHNSPKNQLSVNIRFDPSVAYEIEIRKCKAIMPIDDHYIKVVIPDFDAIRLRLKLNKIIMIQRRCVLKKNGETVWLYGCSCDPEELNFINALDTITDYTQPGFNSNLCQHISAVKPIISDLEKWTEDEDPFSFQQIDCTGGDISEVSFNPKKILVVKDDTVGIVNYDGIKYFCDLCSSPYCQHITYVKSFHEKADCPSVLVELFSRSSNANASQCSSYSYPAASWRKIPFQTDERMQSCLKHDPSKYLELEEGMLICKDELVSCADCNFPLQLTSSNTGILFTKNSYFNCKVFSKSCLQCGKKFDYDGRNDAVFNMQTFMIHHGVLRDYMLHFLNGNSCTLHGYYEVLALTQEQCGNSEFRTLLSYNKLRFCWYAFLSLLDVDTASGYCCRNCGSVPEEVVCDATGLGYQRKFAALALQEDTNAHIYPRFSDHKSRIAMPKKETRELLKEWVSHKTSISQQNRLLAVLRQHHRSIYHALQWTLNTYTNNLIPKPIRNIFQCISSVSPVCSYIQPNDFVYSLAESLFESDVKSNYELLRSIQNHLPVFFEILSCLQIETCLPLEWKGLVLYLVDLSKQPFVSASPVNTHATSSSSEICSFPNLPVLRKRGRYAQDKEILTTTACRKLYKGVCYGFQVMESQESPNVPFTIFKTRFQKAPKVIVYDNACGLHTYCLNRDPLFFKDTLFVSDRFHWKNHTGCAVTYNISKWPLLKNLNSEVNEQQNAATKKLKTQLSYMTTNNFLNHCNFFFWYRNYLKNKL